MRVRASHHSALQYAYRLLNYRDRSEAEIIMKLRGKGFAESEISGAMLRLRETGFLDDRKLAAALKRYAEETKHLSINGTRRFLTGRGIPRDVSDEAVKDIDEVQTARRLVEKRISGWEKHGASSERLRSEVVMLRRLHGILYRRGYAPEAIRKVLGELINKEVLE